MQDYVSSLINAKELVDTILRFEECIYDDIQGNPAILDFQVHFCILARCSYFSQYVDTWKDEKLQDKSGKYRLIKITLPSNLMSETILLKFIHSVYGKEVDFGDDCLAINRLCHFLQFEDGIEATSIFIRKNINNETVFNILEYADICHDTHLRNECLRFCETIISNENVFVLMEMAIKYGDERLKTSCLQYSKAYVFHKENLCKDVYFYEKKIGRNLLSQLLNSNDTIIQSGIRNEFILALMDINSYNNRVCVPRGTRNGGAFYFSFTQEGDLVNIASPVRDLLISPLSTKIEIKPIANNRNEFRMDIHLTYTLPDLYGNFVTMQIMLLYNDATVKETRTLNIDKQTYSNISLSKLGFKIGRCFQKERRYELPILVVFEINDKSKPK